MRKILLSTLLILGPITAHAQSGGSPCPAGMIPGPNRCYNPNELPQQSSSPSSYTGPLWEDRYGALANDGNGAGGVSQNMKSKRAARREALRDCGQKNCEIRVGVRNGCLAATWGGGVSAYGIGDDKEGAESNALNDCTKGGGTNCVVKYSACSLPVRIR